MTAYNSTSGHPLSCAGPYCASIVRTCNGTVLGGDSSYQYQNCTTSSHDKITPTGSYFNRTQDWLYNDPVPT